MDQHPGRNERMDWEEIGQLEADILRGKVTDIQMIRKFFYDICHFCAVQKVGLSWRRRAVDKKQELGLDYSALYTWPLLKRAERVLRATAKLRNNPALLALDKAYICFIQGRYDLTLKELNNPSLQNVKRPNLYTYLLCKTHFHLGNYKEVLLIQQEEFSKYGSNFPGVGGAITIGSINGVVNRLMRSSDIIPYNIPELDKDSKEYDPREDMLNALADFAISAAAPQTIKTKSSKDELISIAEWAMMESLYSPALTYYSAALQLDPTDDETRFLNWSNPKKAYAQWGFHYNL